MRIRIYTDGACSGNPGPGGWAGIILFANTKQVITGGEEETTNNRMELKAVLESLNVALKSADGNTIDIYSDSAYVVNAINNSWLKRWELNGWLTKEGKPVKNKDLWVKLNKLLANKHRAIHFIKVKGHSDNEMNNKCDVLAREEVKKIKE